MDDARMAGLAGLAEEIDGAAPPSPEDMAAQRQADQAAADKAAAEDAALQAARQWAVIPAMIGSVLVMAAPELKPVYCEDNCMRWGYAAGQVATKYGIKDSANIPELALAVSTLGFAVPSFFAIRQAVEAAQGGWLARARMWWRARRARRAGQAGQAAAADQGGDDGRRP